MRRLDVSGVLVHVETAQPAAGLRLVSAAGHGTAGLVVGGARGQIGAAVAFGGVFESGHRKVLGEAEGLTFLRGHVRGGGGGGGEGTAGGLVGAARVGPGC